MQQQHVNNSSIALFECNKRPRKNQIAIDQIYANQIIGFQNSSIQNNSSIQIQSISTGSKEEFIFVLSKNGQVYIWGDFSVPIPQDNQQNNTTISANDDKQNQIKLNKKLFQQQPQQINYFKNVKISIIACTNKVAQFLSSEGTLYAWGDDTDMKYGILGLGQQQYKAQRPYPNSFLFDYMIKSISLSDQHACSIDSNGRLFCWGYGPNGELGLDNVQQISIPTMVTKQKSINIKKGICRNGYTAFCSSTGYTYIYGMISSNSGKMRQSNNNFNKVSNQQQKQTIQNDNQNIQESYSNNHQNKTSNSLIQIISLSESFINDLLGCDTFIIAISSTFDVFFIDDSLEAVQINTFPIQSIALSGSSILGLSTQTRNNKVKPILHEWSTAGLNKLFFNKENKLLLRQDFQEKDFKIKSKFALNSRLCNLINSKSYFALIFDDFSNIEQNFIDSLNIQDIESKGEDDNYNKMFMLAKLIEQGGVFQSQFNPLMLMSDSSINSSRDEKDLFNDERLKSNTKLILMKNDNQFYKNRESIIVKSINSPIIQKQQLYNDNQIIQIDKSIDNKQQIIEQYPQIQQKDSNQVFNYDTQLNLLIEENKQTYNDNIQPSIQQQQQQEFFNDYDQLICQQSQKLNSERCIQSNINQRPSSIKSNNQRESMNNRSSSFNNIYSSPSLKQCAADIIPQDNRDSKVEVSFSSFLNLSNEIYQFNPDLMRNVNSNIEDDNKEDIRNSSPCSSSVPNLTNSKNNDIQLNNKIEYQSEQKVIDNEQMDIQQIQGTTPKRGLNGYNINNRIIQNQETPSERNPIQNPLSSNQKLMSQISINQQLNQQSMLSDGFNITNQSCRTNKYGNDKDLIVERQSQIQQQQDIISLNDSNNSFIQYSDQKLNQILQQKKKTHKKLSNSCGAQCKSLKRQTFIKAILEQSKRKQPFDIIQDITSTSQIYNIPPLIDDSNKMKENYECNQTKQSDNNIIQQDLYQQMQQFIQKYNENNICQIINDYQNQEEDPQILQRDTIGITQTDDNIDVEYSVSNSCTSQSNKSNSIIKRKINFDDSSSGRNGGTLIRMSETTNNNKIFAKFKLSLGNHRNSNGSQKRNSKSFKDSKNSNNLQNFTNGIPMSISNTKKQQMINTNNNDDQSSSFIFNQCLSPQPVLPFNEIDSNIKLQQKNVKSDINKNYNNNQNNATNTIIMTEEKFKNLKSEISQNEQQNQFLISQNTLLSSSSILINDNHATNTKSYDQKQSQMVNGTNQFNFSSLQNISGFLKSNKYLQAYDNFRRAFMSLCKFRDSQKLKAFRQIKQISVENKQRKEFMQGMARFLFNTLKQHVTLYQQIGFKKIKKFYKEKQLQVYIRRKQNEFALKTQTLTKIDALILQYNITNIKSCFQLLKFEYNEMKKLKLQKKQKSSQLLFSFLQRNIINKFEKGIRKIAEFVNEKKIIEMQIKMLSKIMIKILQRQMRIHINDIQQSIKYKQQRQQSVQLIKKLQFKNYFRQFKIRIIEINNKQQQLQNFCILFNKIIIKHKSKKFIRNLKKQQNQYKALIKLNSFIIIQNLKQKLSPAFMLLKDYYQFQIIKEKKQKIYKALALLLYSKLSDLLKQQYKTIFLTIKKFRFQEDTIMGQKSMTSGNLSFNLNNLVTDPSSIITRNFYSNMQPIIDQQYQSNQSSKQKQLKIFDKTSIQYQPKKCGEAIQNMMGKSFSQTKKLDQNEQQIKHNLNDYQSFSPKGIELIENNLAINNFQKRRKADSSTSKAQDRLKNMICETVQSIDYSQIPLNNKPTQNDTCTGQRSRNNNYSLKQETSKLNVSIKDMNRAFRNEISKIKEKQEEKNNDFNMVNLMNETGDDILLQQLDNKYSINYASQNNSKLYFGESIDNQLQTEIELTTTPDLLNNIQIQSSYSSNQQKYKDKKNQEKQPLINISQKLQLNSLKDVNKHLTLEASQPKTSTFGCMQSTKNSSNEYIDKQNEDVMHLIIDKVEQQPITFRNHSQHNKQISIPVKSYKQRVTDSSKQKTNEILKNSNKVNEQDFSYEFDQPHTMFDEFDLKEKEQKIKRFQNTNNIGLSVVKNSLTDLSRKLDLTSILAQDCSIIKNQNNFLYTNYYNKQQTSPEFSESFIPSQQCQQFNREILNELGSNYQLLELTPEVDTQMMINNKSLIQREESIYSINQYADPIEMSTSPNIVNKNIQMIKKETNVYPYTSQFQVDNTNNNINQEVQLNSEDDDEDQDANIENEEFISQDSSNFQGRPYNFELSSNSKYNIISENERLHHILRQDIVQPSMNINKTISQPQPFNNQNKNQELLYQKQQMNKDQSLKQIFTTYNDQNKFSQTLQNKDSIICKKLSFGNENKQQATTFQYQNKQVQPQQQCQTIVNDSNKLIQNTNQMFQGIKTQQRQPSASSIINNNGIQTQRELYQSIDLTKQNNIVQQNKQPQGISFNKSNLSQAIKQISLKCQANNTNNIQTTHQDQQLNINKQIQYVNKSQIKMSANTSRNNYNSQNKYNSPQNGIPLIMKTSGSGSITAGLIGVENKIQNIMSQKSQQSIQQDLISQNILRLKNGVKPTQRY